MVISTYSFPCSYGFFLLSEKYLLTLVNAGPRKNLMCLEQFLYSRNCICATKSEGLSKDKLSLKVWKEGGWERVWCWWQEVLLEMGRMDQRLGFINNICFNGSVALNIQIKNQNWHLSFDLNSLFAKSGKIALTFETIMPFKILSGFRISQSCAKLCILLLMALSFIA